MKHQLCNLKHFPNLKDDMESIGILFVGDNLGEVPLILFF